MPWRHERGVETVRFKPLRAVFEEWLDLMEDDSWTEDGDVPWWYNERAVLSLFVGAVWKTKGWAFEEYSTSKRFKTKRGRGTRAYGGRGDVAIWIGGREYAIEAKSSFPSLSDGGKPIKVISDGLRAGCLDVLRSPHPGHVPVGMVFAAPYIVGSQFDQWRPRLRHFLEELRGQRSRWAMAWTFPRWGLDARLKGSDGKTYVYPGAVLVMRKAH